MKRNSALIFLMSVAPVGSNFKDVLTRYRSMNVEMLEESQRRNSVSKEEYSTRKSISNTEFYGLHPWLKMEWILRDGRLRPLLSSQELSGFPQKAKDQVFWRDIEEEFFKADKPNPQVFNSVANDLQQLPENEKKYFLGESPNAAYWRALLSRKYGDLQDVRWQWALRSKDSDNFQKLCSSYVTIEDQLWFKRSVKPSLQELIRKKENIYLELENLNSGCALALISIYSDLAAENLEIQKRWMALRDLASNPVSFREQMDFVYRLKRAEFFAQAKTAARSALKKAVPRWEQAEAQLELGLLMGGDERLEKATMLREALEKGWGTPIQDKAFPAYIAMFEEAGQFSDADLYRDFWSRFGLTRNSRVEAIHSEIEKQKSVYLQSTDSIANIKRLAFMIRRVSLLASEKALSAKDKELILWIWAQAKIHAKKLPTTALANFYEIVEKVRGK